MRVDWIYLLTRILLLLSYSLSSLDSLHLPICGAFVKRLRSQQNCCMPLSYMSSQHGNMATWHDYSGKHFLCRFRAVNLPPAELDYHARNTSWTGGERARLFPSVSAACGLPLFSSTWGKAWNGFNQSSRCGQYDIGISKYSLP